VKVAMVSEHASPLATLGDVDSGGQNVHVACLARALANLGHEVTVYTRRDDRDSPARVPMCKGVTVVHVTAGPPEPVPKDELLPFMAEMASELRADFSLRPPDVVHAHFWMSGVATVGSARRLGIPTALTFHALGSVKRRQQGTKDTSPSERPAIERAVARAVDRVLATSNEEIFELRRMGVEGARAALVPCGVDTSEFTPDGPTEPRLGHRHRVVVVSRLVERKGIGNMIAALPQLPDTELVVAGGPERALLFADPEARRLERLACDLGVRDRVDLRGRVERRAVAPLIRSADLVACTPWYEPFGLVALEAMACGVPVVATAVGGLADTVIDGVTGVHVRPRDVDSLAHAVNELLGDPERRAQLGRAGLHRARRGYDWATIAAETARSYLLAKNQPTAAVRRVG
jgi:D-inositol-3-phosphate glycosyltransferase